MVSSEAKGFRENLGTKLECHFITIFKMVTLCDCLGFFSRRFPCSYDRILNGLSSGMGTGICLHRRMLKGRRHGDFAVLNFFLKLGWYD